MAADDNEMELAMNRLAEVTTQLRESTMELRRTIHATRLNRRTPDEIRAILARARSVVYQSSVIKRALKARFRVQ